MLLLEKDKRVLSFLSDYGCSTSEMVRELLGYEGANGLVYCHRRLLRLHKMGLISKQGVLGTNRKVYWISSLGKDVLRSNGGHVYGDEEISLGNIIKNRMVQRVVCKLYQGGIRSLISKRKMRLDPDHKRGYVPLLTAVMGDEKRVGIEIMSNLKSPRKMIDRFKQVNKSMYTDIIYLASDYEIEYRIYKAYKKISSSFKLHTCELNKFFDQAHDCLELMDLGFDSEGINNQWMRAKDKGAELCLS